MPTDVVMPQMGESIFEGTITKWLKKTGDVVQKDEPLFEISTDKVDAEISSPVAGVLSEIKIQEGATVGINTVVAVVTESGEAGAGARVPETRDLETRDPEAQVSDAQVSAAKVQEAQVHEAADGSASPLSPPASPGPAKVAPTSLPAVKFEAARTAASGATEVVMPQMGESIFEGTITKWLKKLGDAVEKDEPLFEISTDKVDAEIPSPVAGVLSEIRVSEGETVTINTVVAVIGSAGEVGAAPVSSPSVRAAPGPDAKAPAIEKNLSVAEPGATERLRSSPLVRRMAAENSIDLGQIAGTGSAGRITKEDILKHLSGREKGTQTGSVAFTTASAATQASATRAISAAAAADLAGKTAPLSRMRSIIADRMVESAATSPHVYVVYKVDMTRVVRLREAEKARFEQKHGVKLTYMPFIAAAAIEALRAHPVVNASLVKAAGQAGSIQYHANVNLGIAVALDWGLIVPVVKQAEALSFMEVARAMADLADRARTKKLKPEEASGSTFTLTNFGVFGGEFGTPIINQPESAILAIGGLKKEPVVLTDGEGNDSVAIRSMQSYCLGFDHRLIDGADAGKFMSTFKSALEGWDRPIK